MFELNGAARQLNLPTVAPLQLSHTIFLSKPIRQVPYWPSELDPDSFYPDPDQDNSLSISRMKSYVGDTSLKPHLNDNHKALMLCDDYLEYQESTNKVKPQYDYDF